MYKTEFFLLRPEIRSVLLVCLGNYLFETGAAVFLKSPSILWLFYLQIRHPWGCWGRFSSLFSHVFSVVTQVKPQDGLWCVITISSLLNSKALTPDSWDTGPYRCGLEHILSELLELLEHFLHSWDTALIWEERIFSCCWNWTAHSSTVFLSPSFQAITVYELVSSIQTSATWVTYTWFHLDL